MSSSPFKLVEIAVDTFNFKLGNMNRLTQMIIIIIIRLTNWPFPFRTKFITPTSNKTPEGLQIATIYYAADGTEYNSRERV
jgi:hypothetical protein